jgi:hypothetical protein
MSSIKRVAPLFSFAGALFFFYGFYLLMFRENVFDSMMFIVAYLLFIYASVIMDDEWELARERGNDLSD